MSFMGSNSCGTNDYVPDIVNGTESQHGQVKDAEVQTDEPCDRATPGSAAFTVKTFVDDPPAVHFYTGLKSYATFQFVLSTLGPAIYHLNYYDGSPPPLDLEDQFFLTLIKLRRHKTNYELSILFRLSVSRVTSVFVTLANFMYAQWIELD